MDVGSLGNIAVEALEVGKAVPRFAAHEGSMLPLGIPEEPYGCAARHAGYGVFVSVEHGGSTDLFAEDEGFVGKGLHTEGHKAFGRGGYGEGYGGAVGGNLDATLFASTHEGACIALEA